MNIHKQRITPDQVGFLQDDQTLYVCDFRATAESMEYNIPAMWKYENLFPWILKNQRVTVNEDARSIKYRSRNELVRVLKGKDAKKSIFSKLKDSDLKKVKKLWASIPHPDADHIAYKWKLMLNEKYSDFLIRNSKQSQKQLLGRLTPKWQVVYSLDELRKIERTWKRGYIKRAQGSGGFAVFPFSQTHSDDFLSLFHSGSDIWFVEKEIRGTFHSIQLVTERGKTTVFGLTDQLMSDQHYSGSRLRPLEELTPKVWLILHKAIAALHPLWKSYTGFWGIDYVIDTNGHAYILEANIRQTAATIPALLNNLVQSNTAIFREDAHSSGRPGEMILARDHSNNTFDLLQFTPHQGNLGSAAQIALSGCRRVSSSINRSMSKKIERLLWEHVSPVVKSTHFNFWPFGWTMTFILADSHCVISSWYLEKKILIDILSCSVDSDFRLFSRHIARLFGAKKISLKIKEIA